MKSTLRSSRVIREFLKFTHLLPSGSAWTWIPSLLRESSYVSSSLKEILQDLVFTCQIDKKLAFCYLLVEHHSRPDWLMPLRFIKANIGIIEDYLGDRKGAIPWPTIYNMCLYHGPRQQSYPYPVRMYDYFQDRQLAEALGAFSQFHLIDLGQQSDKELESHKVIGLMEKLMKYSRDRQLFGVLEAELDRCG
ncbi:MAG: Rpn family recombination-promoting nuclease/putative transposase [Bacteroidota bacterium]